MISQCLVNNPQERPAAKDLCDHALFHVPDFNPKGVLLSLLLTSPPGEIKTPWKLASRLQQKRSYFDGHIPQLCLESSTDDGSSEEDVEAEAATHSQQCREPCAAEEPAAVAGLLEVETEVLLEQHVAPMSCMTCRFVARAPLRLRSSKSTLFQRTVCRSASPTWLPSGATSPTPRSYASLSATPRLTSFPTPA
eukprot:Colp12_sorted_trinity150504_noHs@7974